MLCVFSADSKCAFDISQLESLCDPAQPRRVLLDIVHLRDLRGRVSEQIRDLSRRQRADRTIRLLDAIDEVRGEGVADRVQSLLFDACRIEDAVVAASEVDRARVAAVLVGEAAHLHRSTVPRAGRGWRRSPPGSAARRACSTRS